MRVLLFLFFISNFYGSLASDSIPDINLLFESIDSFYAQSTRAQVAEFEAPEELAWMKYVPAVGVTYTLDGKPRPSASWSTNIIYNARQDKNLRLAQIDGVGKINELLAAEDKRRVQELVTEFNYLKEDIRFSEELILIDKELFDLLKRKFDDGDLDSSSWLKAKKDLKQKEYNLFTKDRDVLKLRSEILLVAKWSNL